MGSAEEPPPLVEPIPVQTVFMSGVDAEDMGDGTVLFTGYTKQRNPLDGTWERVVIARYVMPKDGLLKAMHQTARVAFGWHLAGEVGTHRDMIPSRQH